VFFFVAVFSPCPAKAPRRPTSCTLYFFSRLHCRSRRPTISCSAGVAVVAGRDDGPEGRRRRRRGRRRGFWGRALPVGRQADTQFRSRMDYLSGTRKSCITNTPHCLSSFSWLHLRNRRGEPSWSWRPCRSEMCPVGRTLPLAFCGRTKRFGLFCFLLGLFCFLLGLFCVLLGLFCFFLGVVGRRRSGEERTQSLVIVVRQGRDNPN